MRSKIFLRSVRISESTVAGPRHSQDTSWQTSRNAHREFRLKRESCFLACEEHRLFPSQRSHSLVADRDQRPAASSSRQTPNIRGTRRQRFPGHLITRSWRGTTRAGRRSSGFCWDLQARTRRNGWCSKSARTCAWRPSSSMSGARWNWPRTAHRSSSPGPSSASRSQRLTRRCAGTRSTQKVLPYDGDVSTPPSDPLLIWQDNQARQPPFHVTTGIRVLSTEIRHDRHRWRLPREALDAMDEATFEECCPQRLWSVCIG